MYSPITTYSGRGCDQDGLPTDQITKHIAISMVKQRAVITDTERAKGMLKDTLYATPSSWKREATSEVPHQFRKVLSRRA